MQAGKFLTFEGIDGAGKTSLLRHAAAVLRARGVSVIETREPGGTPIGEQLRRVLLDTPVSAETELLLIMAARAEHVRSVIVPALARGQWVLADRFSDSSHAYQGAGRGISGAWISQLDEFACGGLRPYRTFLVDLPADTARARLEAIGKGGDQFERRGGSEYFERIRGGFLARAAQDPDRFIVIDGTPPLDQINKLLEEYIVNIGII